MSKGMGAFCLAVLFLTFACGDEPASKPGGVGQYPPVRSPAPDSAREGIVLPVAAAARAEYPAEPFLELVPLASGDIWVDGVRRSKEDFLQAMGELKVRRDRYHAAVLCTEPVLVTADGEVPWGVVDGCFFGCLFARMSRVHLAVRRSPDTTDTALLLTVFSMLEDESTAGTPMDYMGVGPSLTVRKQGDETVVAVTDGMGKQDPDGPPPVALGSSKLDTLLADLAVPEQKLMGETLSWRQVRLSGEPEVPYRHVVTLADACLRAGFDRIVFQRPEILRLGANVSLCRIESGPLSVAPAVPSKVRRKMRVPVADLANGPEGKNMSVQVAVTHEGELFVRGRPYDPKSLKTTLYKYAETNREMREESRPSGSNVLITADARRAWREVREVMMICAAPELRIYRIYWTVDAPDGEERHVAVFLPKDRGLAPTRPERTPQVNVRVMPGDDGGGMVLSRGANEYGRGAKGLAEMKKRLKAHREKYPGLKVLLECAEDLPFGDVVKALEAARSAGVKDVHFAGR